MANKFNDKFWMFPFNETGKEIEKVGYKLDGTKYGLTYDLFYTIIDDINLLIDEITGMVVWGDTNEIGDNIEEFFNKVLDKKSLEYINTIHNNLLRNGVILTHCTKKIKYHFQKQNLFYKDGKTPSALSKFDFLQFFKQIIYCKDFGQQTSASNAVLINPTHFIIPRGKKENVIDFNSIGIAKLSMIPSIHVIKIPEVIRRGNCGEITTFYIDKYLFGYFMHDVNVLIIPDITKNKETKWFEPIFEYLKANYFVSRKNYTKSDKPIITVGCDPEFELYDSKNKLVIGEDLNADGRLQRKIGADGRGKQLELRPEPSTDPAEVVEDLQNLFKAVSNFRVDSKGDKEPLGGHIHFGVVSSKPVGKLSYTQTVVEMLDAFIGKHTRPMSGSARGEYGRLGDIRDQPWGFEYRTCPAGIFTTKEIAYVTLKLARNLVQAILERDIDVEFPLTKESLLDFLTPEEAEFYLMFPDKFKSYDSNSIIKYWTTEYIDPIEIRFYDKWSNNTKEIYKTMLKDTIVDGKTVLCLYGLKSSKASGIETLGSSVPHPRGVHCEEGIAIGLPKTCRIDGYAHMEIIKDIKRKIGSVNGVTIPKVTAILFPDEMIGCDVTPDTRDEEPVEVIRHQDDLEYLFDENEAEMRHHEEGNF